MELRYWFPNETAKIEKQRREYAIELIKKYCDETGSKFYETEGQWRYCSRHCHMDFCEDQSANFEYPFGRPEPGCQFMIAMFTLHYYLGEKYEDRFYEEMKHFEYRPKE